jgi:hypothetical protein
MAWIFDRGAKRKRRMGEVARPSWRARWENFWSHRQRAGALPPSRPKKPVRPPKITDYDEADRPPRGRKLPRWQRELQAGVWKITRPVRRFHARVPVGVLILFYLGLLAVLSGGLVLAVLGGDSPAPPVAVQEVEETTDEAPMTWEAGLSPGRSAASFKLSDGGDPDVLQQMADIEFRAGNYARAEGLYRRYFPKSSSRPLIGYRIYVCALMRGDQVRANDLLPRLMRVGAKTPAWIYGRATLAFREGRREEAAALLEEGRSLYGDDCADYDEVLRVLGYAP